MYVCINNASLCKRQESAEQRELYASTQSLNFSWASACNFHHITPKQSVTHNLRKPKTIRIFVQKAYLRSPLVRIRMPFLSWWTVSARKKLYWIHSCQIVIGFTWKTYAFLTSSSLRGPARGRPRAFLSDWDPTTKGSSQWSLFQALLLWDWVVQLHPSLHWNPESLEYEYEDFWDWFVHASLHVFSNLLVASASKSSSVFPSLCHPNIYKQTCVMCDISTKKKKEATLTFSFLVTRLLPPARWRLFLRMSISDKRIWTNVPLILHVIRQDKQTF